MTTLTKDPTYVNDSGNVSLSASDVVTGPSGGYVVAGPNFQGYTLTLTSTFASDLYTALSSPSLLYAYPVTFSCGAGNTFTLANADSHLDTSVSTTFANNLGTIDSAWQPTILFVLDSTSPPHFTLYG